MGLRFSIVIPCLSSSDVLAVTLRALAVQQFRDFEVIVVDDGSTPSLSETFEAFQLPTWKYTRNDQPTGRAAARNKGINLASGEIIVFMDVDQRVLSDYLSALDIAFGTETRQSVRANTAVEEDLLPKSAFLRFYNSRFLGNRPSEALKGIDLCHLPAKYFATTCIATGRIALDEVGLFDEAFRRYGCEDEELGLRLESAGVPLSLSLEAKSFSTDGSLTVRRACSRMVEYARDSVPLLLEKHPQYAEEMASRMVEGSAAKRSIKEKLARLALTLFGPWLASTLLDYLERSDSRANFNPPSSLYQLALAGYYMQGFRSRSRATKP